jgi:hypothetical protein
LSHLPEFFAQYPDAYVVLTHRDPLAVLPSMTSLMATLRWQHSDTVDIHAVVKSVVFGTAIVFDHIARLRDDGRLPNDRIVDVRYDDLMLDPSAALRDVYDRTDRRLTPELETRMLAYLAAKPKGRGGAHTYAFADTGLDRVAVRERFADYMARYQVAEEA